MVRSSPDYEMSRFMVQYALAWAMWSQDLDKALYNDMKKANLPHILLQANPNSAKCP